ncbi:iron-containing redox enzyme family protein [Actinophytocola sp.]|uniref:iron-containing redox enzyme family protein n=1 Tax=Actinophytocola sp. TaxID=1872138 RepID=UPI003D6BC09D
MELPDRTTSSALTTFEFGPGAAEQADTILASGPDDVFRRLVRDQESEPVLLAARRILHAMLPSGADSDGDQDTDQDTAPDAVAERVAAARAEIGSMLDTLARHEPAHRGAALRERAALGQISGCWLDTVSSPATQPALIVNRLLRDHFALKGAGNPQRSVHHVRRRALEQAGVYLPEITADDFLPAARTRPLTAWHACFYLALSRLATSFLPEVVGVHYAYHALGVDDRLAGVPELLTEQGLRESLAEYLSLTRDSVRGPAERARLRAAVTRTVELELAQVRLLVDLADWHAARSLHSRFAEIVARHAPFAGRHHGTVTVRGRRLTEAFADPDLDLAAFLDELRRSRQVKPLPSGGCRLLNALRFGGPMFGIFDSDEAATITAWVERAQAGDRSPIEIEVNRLGDDAAARWGAAVASSSPPDLRFAEPNPRDERELFYRLVNVEHFANVLPLARQRAIAGFVEAEVLFTHGARGRYTNASWFDYSPEALGARVDRIYWEKLVEPYHPLAEIPDREEVRFGQADLALGNMIDGAWAHRIGNVGRFRRRSDGLLFAIYVDEMGRGELHKNHLTLIYQVLASMDFTLPHIRDAAFTEQDQLSESHRQYESANHQLSMSMFPDSFYNEILGYNLGIEMYGLGEMRMNEIQRLRHHGFDTAYEEAHLTIDNFSAGHSRQSVDAIVTYLDDVRRDLGASAVEGEWRRVWRGYASFAYFAEPQLVAELTATGGAHTAPESADELVI